MRTAPDRPRARAPLIAGVVGLGIAAAVDLLAVTVNGDPVWPAALVLTVGLAALLWPARARPPWLTPTVRTVAPAIASAAYTVAALKTGVPTTFGPGEPVILLCLLLIAVRTCPPVAAMVAPLVVGVSLLAVPLRAEDDDIAYGLSALLAVLAGAVAGLGGYLRTLDHRRDAAVAETRRAERLSMAADLHDFVAHHVTGILAQAQLARLLAGTQPDRLDAVLARIEQASRDTLGAMRGTVGLLRTSDAGQPTTGDLAALPGLVTGFHESDGIRAVLHHDPGIPDSLPHQIQAAAYRVVQEALTNVRRHAAHATEVAVDLRYIDGQLAVAVRNNGDARLAKPATSRGGHFGLIGLSERVTALGGRLHAGAQPTGGWQLVAPLPIQ
jgi:signal transduction histidine kinase